MIKKYRVLVNTGTQVQTFEFNSKKSALQFRQDAIRTGAVAVSDAMPYINGRPLKEPARKAAGK